MKQNPEIKVNPITKKNSDPKFLDKLKYINDSNFNMNFYNGNSYIENIEKVKILIKEIIGDGNCFFRAISYYLHNTEYNSNYRQLANELCLNSKEDIKNFF